MEALGLGVLNDGRCHRVVQPLLGRGGQPGQPLELQVAVEHVHMHHRGMPLGQGAGLVKDDDIDINQLLESPAAADQQTLGSGAGQCRHDRGRNGHPQTGAQIEHQQGRGLGHIARTEQQ